MWSEGRTFILRSAIFVGLASVVTTIIYYTPLPDSDFISSRCERPCHELEMPMICRVKLHLEAYETLTRSCGDCPRNSSDCFQRDCVLGDGIPRPLMTANRQLAGLSMQVCENDILLVDVVNRLPGREVSFHWRGQPQKETPFMDGVAMVTQCPIPSGTTFRYKFRASRAGTHLWHAHHTGGETDQMFGALVVRQPESRIAERDLYDLDDRDHLIVLSSLGRGPVGERGSLLINGRTSIQREGVGEDLLTTSSFLVTQGHRYRFRVAHAGQADCPVSLSVDSHPMTVIALDGNLIQPKTVDSILLSAGERADIVVHADQRNASYLLHATPAASCADPPNPAVAVLRYSGAETAASPSAETPGRRLRTDFKECREDDEEVCLSELHSSTEMSERLRETKTDSTLYLAFGYTRAPRDRPLFPGTKDGVVPHINNISYTSPSSPLLTQSRMGHDFCNRESRPARCRGVGVCECVHVVDIPLGYSVELVLVDEGGVTSDHVFHLHGYHFHVVGTTVLDQPMSLSEAQLKDGQGTLLTRNFDRPVVKDTVTIPSSGVAALRFGADNPGYWLLEAQRGGSRVGGMSVVLHVGGDGKTPPAPEDFPQCASWVGPDFFLI